MAILGGGRDQASIFGHLLTCGSLHCPAPSDGEQRRVRRTIEQDVPAVMPTGAHPVFQWEMGELILLPGKA